MQPAQPRPAYPASDPMMPAGYPPSVPGMPIAQPHPQPHPQPPPPMHAIPAAVPAPPVAAPAPAPPKPADATPKKAGWLKEKIDKYGKWLAVALAASIVYGAYVIYERRQPYEWSGAVEMRAVSVGSRVGGRVAKVMVREGQQVEQGDILIVLDEGPLQAQRAIAEADVAAAEATLEKLSNGARPEEVAQAMARLQAARAAAGQAGAMAQHEAHEAARTKNLVTGGALSRAELDAVISRQKTTGAGASQAVARAKEEEAALRVLTAGTRPEDVRVARSQLEVAKAKLALVEGQLQELNIRAPARARVEAIAVRPGDIIKADARAVTLLEAGQLYVRIYIPEPRLGQVHIGQEVPVSVDAFPKRTFRGRIDHINEVGEFTPRRLVTTEERADEVFATRISLLEGDNELKAGMAAFIHVKK